MKITIHVVTIDHRHGSSQFVNQSEDDLRHEVECWCREWAEREGVTLTDDMTTTEVIDTYFEAVEDEFVRFDEHTIEVYNEDHEDAERWRALMSSQRMHFMGSAGFRHVPKDGDAGNRQLVNQTPIPRDGQQLHFGMEFWDVAEKDDRFPDTFERELLTVYVDTLRGRSK